jgi:uncharacterized membrane protein YdbT with pleckstrin-like domain
MFCIHCGEDNLATAKFCRKCGEPAGESEEVETRVVPKREEMSDALREREAEPEQRIFTISPTLLFVKLGYVATAVAALFVVAAASAFAWAVVPIWLAVGLGLLLFLIPAFYHFKQKMVSYTLTETKLEIDEGFISRTTRSVPLRRIQDVTVSATVFQRLLGFGNLSIDNASDDGGKIVLANINNPKEHADTLLRQMRRLEG